MGRFGRIWLLPRGWVRVSVGQSSGGRGDQAGALGPGEAPAHPCPSHVVPVSTGQAEWGGAGRMVLIKSWLGQTRPVLYWNERE